jgi:hypothetical protein
MGPQMCQLLATLYVTSLLTLVTLGASDPTGGFCLGTLSLADALVIIGPILDTVVVSHDVAGTSCEELGWHVNFMFTTLFTMPARPSRFASSVVTPRGYKANGCSCVQPISYRTISHRLPASFPTAEKKEG